MTYCVGILVREGLVMIADTRTNAGLDNIAVFRKLHVFERSGERVLAIATSGNLSVSQTALSLVVEGLDNPDTGETETPYNVSSMFKAAQLVGRAVRKVYESDGAMLERQGMSFDMMALVGGQIGDGKLRLFQIYSAGNFIESTADTPYMQIGEHKYGKPILDRAIAHDVDLYDALKIGLISMDSTMRSNLGVGMPVDLVLVRPDALRPEITYRIEQDEPYFQNLRERWSSALRDAHQAIPRPPYVGPAASRAEIDAS